jgi:heptaprenyl diphosphate synthase
MNAAEALRLPGIETALEKVEVSLGKATSGEDPFLAEVASHLVNAGGKRLRPALVLAAAQACGSGPNPSTQVIEGAVAVELVHLGSLYHDDVMDEATSRRGVMSANAKWGNLVAILAGDFLLARASEIAASLGTEIAALLARTIGKLCEGEVGQMRFAYDVMRTEESYVASIGGKTASLMATAARVGGVTFGAVPDEVEALTGYGYSLGMTFQIWDDVKDLISTDDDLGKTAGHDMVEGTYTLPVLRALAVPGVGDDLRAILGSPLDTVSRDKARELVLSTSAIDSSIATARQWASRAEAALEPMRHSAPFKAGTTREGIALLDGEGHRLVDELTDSL